MSMSAANKSLMLAGAAALLTWAGPVDDAAAQGAPSCPSMRKISIAVAVAPPNVVHTSPYVAKALGFFSKRCIDANIIQFEGGQSATAITAVAQGTVLGGASDVAIGRGLKIKQLWGLAPRLPHGYMVAEGIKTPADLKGKRLSATGGGVGGFNWRMGRELLRMGGLDVGDANFLTGATAGRLPGLVANQVDGVALHPEDVHLALKQKPTLSVLKHLSEVMPLYQFNTYGAAIDWINRDRALLRDTIAGMIEANRAMFTARDKVVPTIVEATQKPKEAVEYAIDVLTRNCVWSVNEGLEQKRSMWTIDYSVQVGDIEPDKKPSFEQLADMALAREAVEAAGGRVKLGDCTE